MATAPPLLINIRHRVCSCVILMLLYVLKLNKYVHMVCSALQIYHISHYMLHPLGPEGIPNVTRSEPQRTGSSMNYSRYIN